MDKQIRDLLLEILSNLPAESAGSSSGVIPTGVARYDIDGLMTQLENVGEPVEILGLPSPGFRRVFHPSERDIFSADARGLLIELTGAGLLSAMMLEEIIEYARLVAIVPLDRAGLTELLPTIFTDPEAGTFLSRDTFTEMETLH